MINAFDLIDDFELHSEINKELIEFMSRLEFMSRPNQTANSKSDNLLLLYLRTVTLKDIPYIQEQISQLRFVLGTIDEKKERQETSKNVLARVHQLELETKRLLRHFKYVFKGHPEIKERLEKNLDYFNSNSYAFFTEINEHFRGGKNKASFFLKKINQQIELLLELRNQTEEEIDLIYSGFSIKSKTKLYTFWAMVLVFFITGSLITFTSINTILNPIKTIVSKVKNISQGDLRESINYQAKDELGELVVSFNHFIKQIETIIKDILKNSFVLQNEAKIISSSVQGFSMSSN